MEFTVVLGALLIGALHGLEPGHGWPVAVYYSLRKQNRVLNGLASSLIIAFFHY